MKDWWRTYRPLAGFVVLALFLVVSVWVNNRNICEASNAESRRVKVFWIKVTANTAEQKGFIIVPSPKGERRYPVVFDRSDPKEIERFFTDLNATYRIRDC